MGGLFEYYLNKNQQKHKDYSDQEQWVSLLGEEHPGAIHHLYYRIMKPIRKLVQWNNLNDQWAEELIQDCIVLFIYKINQGQYVYKGIDPFFYVMELAKNNLNNYKRKDRKHSSVELDIDIDVASLPESDLEETCRKLEALLKLLDPNCERLIRLKYLEEKKDAEVIENAYTQYTTTNALKNKRAQCFKKLVELSKQYKSS